MAIQRTVLRAYRQLWYSDNRPTEIETSQSLDSSQEALLQVWSYNLHMDIYMNIAKSTQPDQPNNNSASSYFWEDGKARGTNQQPAQSQKVRVEVRVEARLYIFLLFNSSSWCELQLIRWRCVITHYTNFAVKIYIYIYYIYNIRTPPHEPDHWRPTINADVHRRVGPGTQTSQGKGGEVEVAQVERRGAE